MNKSEIVATLMKIPYSQHIREIDLDAEEDAVRFIWRGDAFRVSASGGVEEITNGFLSGSNIAILMEEIVKKAYTNDLIEKDRRRIHGR